MSKKKSANEKPQPKPKLKPGTGAKTDVEETTSGTEHVQAHERGEYIPAVQGGKSSDFGESE